VLTLSGRSLSKDMIKFLKSAQLAIALGVILLSWSIYPGVMAFFASAIGLIYVAVSVGAFQEKRIPIWIAFAFSTVVAVVSALGVNRFLRNGFDFVAGNFPHGGGVYLPPYLFLAISITSMLVVIAHLISWRWLVGGETENTV